MSVYIRSTLSRIHKYRAFIKSVGAYSLSNILERAIPFILLPILTKFLSPADFGVVSTFTALTVTIQPFITIASSGAIGRAYFDRHNQGFDYHTYLFNGLLINFVLFILMACVIIIFAHSIPSVTLFDPLWVFLLLIYTWSTTMWSVRQSLWIMQQNSITFAAFRFAKLFINALVSIILIITILRSWKGRVLGIVATEVVFGVLAIYLIAKTERIRISLHWGYIKDILKYGLPFLPHTLGWMLITTVDKYFLNAFEGVSVTGVYTVGYTIGSMLNIFVAPIDISAGPIIYEKLGKMDSQVAHKLVGFIYFYFVILIVGAIGIWLISPLIISLFINHKYHGAGIYVLWIALGFASHGMYRLLSYFISYSKKTYYFAYITFLSGIVAVAANYGLIKINGPIGAAQATFLSYTVSFLLTCLVANKLYPMPWISFFRRLKFRNALVP